MIQEFPVSMVQNVIRKIRYIIANINTRQKRKWYCVVVFNFNFNWQKSLLINIQNGICIFFPQTIDGSLTTEVKRKNFVIDDRENAQSKSPPRKLQRTHEISERNLHILSSSSESHQIEDSDEGDDKNLNVNTETSDEANTVTTTKLNECGSPTSVKLNTDANLPIFNFDAQEKIIKELFLVTMPKDFYQFYEFCKSI